MMFNTHNILRVVDKDGSALIGLDNGWSIEVFRKSKKLRVIAWMPDGDPIFIDIPPETLQAFVFDTARFGKNGPTNSQMKIAGCEDAAAYEWYESFDRDEVADVIQRIESTLDLNRVPDDVQVMALARLTEWRLAEHEHGQFLVKKMPGTMRNFQKVWAENSSKEDQKLD